MSGEGTKAGAVFWEFGADLTPFQQKLATAKSEATSEGGGAGESFGSQFKEGLTKGLGIGAGLGIAKVVEEGVGQVKEFLQGAIESATALEAAESRMGAALDANVPKWKDQTEAIDAQREAAARLGFTSEEQIASFTKLATASHSVERAISDQNTAMDLARFKNISLDDATQLLVQVEAGRYRGLAQLGIQLDAHASKTQALAAIQAAVAGQAKAYLNTTAGAEAQANAAIQELSEKVGTALLPAIRDAAHWLAQDLIPDVEKLAAEMQNALKPLGDFLSPVGGIGGIGVAIGEVIPAIDSFASIMGDLEHLDFSGAKNDYVAYLQGIVSATQAGQPTMIGAWAGIFGSIANTVKQGMTDARTDLDQGLQNLPNDVASVGHELQTQMYYAFQGVPKAVMAQLPATKAAAHSLARALPDEISQVSAGAIYNAGLTEAANLAKGLRDGRGNVVSALNQFIIDQKQTAKLSAEAGLLGGILSSAGLAQGLASNIPAVAGDAAALEQAVEAQLQHMPAFANAVGIDIANALAKGMQHIRDTAGPPLDGLDTSIKRTQIQASSGWKIAQGEGSPTDFTNILKGMGVVIPHVTGGLADIAKSLGAIGTVGGGGGAAGGASKGLGGVSAASKAATQAAKDHKQALQDEASTLKDKLGTALDAAKTKALDYFARVHAANLAAITDSHNRATAEIADSKKIIDQHLAETEAADNKVVTDAEAAQKAIDDARQLRDLTQGVSDAQKQVADAQVGGDASAIASAQNALTHAQESLQDFQAQQQIAVLKATAETANAAAQTQADADKAKLDADQKAADDLAKQQTTAEDKRYKGQVAAFDVEWKALVKHLEDTKKAHTDTVAAIEKVYGDFNLQAEPVAKAFGTKYAAGLIASKKTIETNAAALAQVIADFLKTHSPAKRGPLHEHSPEDMAQGFVRSYAHSWTDAMSGFKPTVPSFAALTVPPPAAAATSGAGPAGTWSSPAPGSPGDPFAQYNAAQATRALQAGEMVGLKNSFAWYDQFHNNGAGGGLAANGQGGAADHGVHIEHVDIHNPVERTAGDSMSDLMRTKAVLGGTLS